MIYLVLTCFFAVTSFLIGIPFLYLIVYLAVFIISQFVSYHFADRSLSFWKTPDGSIYSMDGLLIHVVYIVSVVLRFAISLAYIGSPSFQYQIEASGQLDSKSEVVTFAIIVADIFMIFGLGLLIGLNKRLLNSWCAIPFNSLRLLLFTLKKSCTRSSTTTACFTMAGQSGNTLKNLL